MGPERWNRKRLLVRALGSLGSSDTSVWWHPFSIASASYMNVQDCRHLNVARYKDNSHHFTHRDDDALPQASLMGASRWIKDPLDALL